MVRRRCELDDRQPIIDDLGLFPSMGLLKNAVRTLENERSAHTRAADWAVKFKISIRCCCLFASVSLSVW
jgi:hypothetical protein